MLEQPGAAFPCTPPTSHYSIVHSHDSPAIQPHPSLYGVVRPLLRCQLDDYHRTASHASCDSWTAARGHPACQRLEIRQQQWAASQLTQGTVLVFLSLKAHHMAYHACHSYHYEQELGLEMQQLGPAVT